MAGRRWFDGRAGSGGRRLEKTRGGTRIKVIFNLTPPLPLPLHRAIQGGPSGGGVPGRRSASSAQGRPSGGGRLPTRSAHGSGKAKRRRPASSTHGEQAAPAPAAGAATPAPPTGAAANGGADELRPTRGKGRRPGERRPRE